MSGIKIIVSTVVMFLVLTAAGDSYADRRSYVWTYEYMTMLEKRWELETYVTAEVPDSSKSNINSIKPQLELEYGITDRWDIAMYQMWKFNNKAKENDSEYEGFKLRTRYKIGEKGRYLLDPLLYFEYIREDDLSRPNLGEAKLVLAKDAANLNLSYNQILKRNIEREGKPDHEYAIGASRAFTQRLKIGVESKGSYSKEKYAFGPAVSYVFKKSYLAAGAVFGGNSRTDDVQARVIVGVLF